MDKASILKAFQGTGGANLPFSIGCRTDALVVVKRAAVNIEGAIAATVEFKKRVGKQSVLQAKATWVCASLNSHLPVLSVLTDMEHVFAAFYTRGQKDNCGNTVCIQHLFPGSKQLFEFMHNTLNTIPANVLRFQASGDLALAEELPEPKRVRLPVPRQQHSLLWRDAMRVLVQHAACDPDVANLEDLNAFEDQDPSDMGGLAHKHSMMYT